MLALQRSLSLGYLRQHPTRSVLVVLSIALGVSTLVATRLLNQSVNRAAREAVNPLARKADLLVVNAQTGVPRELASELRKADIPGLLDAQPIILGRISVPELDGNGRSIWLFGIDWSAAARRGGDTDDPWGIEVHWTDGQPGVRDYAVGRLLDLASGVIPWRRSRPALVGEGLAHDLAQAHGGHEPGQFKVLAVSRRHDLALRGTVSFRDAGPLDNGNFVVMDVRDAARLVFPQRPENTSYVSLLLKPGADREGVRRLVQKQVGDTADVRTLEENFRSVRDVTAGLELGFDIGGAGALVVGLFLVYNILAVSVAERRHDIGILRSVGATRRQVGALFLSEAAGLGLAGSALGLPLGWGLAWLSLGPLLRLLNDVYAPMDAASLRLTPVLILAALAAGASTALLAAFIPALQAASEEPADAVRRVPRSARLRQRVLHVAAVLLLLAAGFACVLARGELPPRAGVFAGAVVFFVAMLVLIPLVAEALGRLLQPLVRSSLGMEGRLAADNLVRSPGRTGIVIAALAASGSLVFHVAGFIHSTKAAIHTWIEQSVAADLFVTCGGSVDSASLVQPMDEKVGAILAEGLKDEVEAIVGVRFHLLDYRDPRACVDRLVFMLAIDADAFRKASSGHGGKPRPQARNLSNFPRLHEGGAALVSENFAELYGVHPGDRLEIRGRHGPLTLDVVGTMVDYTWNRGTILVDRAWYRKEFQDEQVDIWDVYLKPDTDTGAVRQQIATRWGKSEALQAATRAQLHHSVETGLDRVYNLAYAQEFIVGLVTLLGVVSALFISVLQRRRELGLLRAVGATRAQVLGTVLAEASLMGLFGAVIGFFVGLAQEWYLVRLILIDEAGFVFPMLIPWTAAAVVFGLSVVLATLVGLWPAYHATRLRIAEAIAYE
jgi:putative ABC transport system permease protein